MLLSEEVWALSVAGAVSFNIAVPDAVIELSPLIAIDELLLLTVALFVAVTEPDESGAGLGDGEGGGDDNVFESGAGLGEGVGLEEVSGFADGVGVGPAFIELLPVLESVVELFVTAELLSTVAEGSELVEEFSAGAGVISSAKTSLGSMVL